jgi:DNA helicase-2/ATP-dependent DNA helicase PcrA
VVVAAGVPIPSPWAGAPLVTVDEDTLADPGPVVADLQRAFAEREPIVVSLAVDPGRFRPPPSVGGEVWTHGPGLRLWHEELQWFVWANTYDARPDGPPVWWWGRKALRAGARPLPAGAPGDVEVPGVGPVWVDGGPRQPWAAPPGGLPVLHREAVERGRADVDPAWRPPVADLAEDQLRAVGHMRGPARIIAPAGSGKTRVLTERVRHLLGDRRWHPDAVLAVAYNKKAQEEIEQRCAGLAVRTRTLNSLGLWVLTQAGGGRQPQVLAERDCRDLVRALAPRTPRRANTDPIAPYLEALGRARLALVDPEDVEAERDDVPGLAELFPGYRAALQERGAVDFDEQVYGAVEVLLADGALRQRLQVSCRHLLVDEFQDLTPAHILLLRLLAGPGADVFGVGDDDQVIYGHAGADPGFLIDFARLFPGATAHPLEVNWRCPPAVVAAASSLLSYNHRRVPKTIRAGRPLPAPEAPESLMVRLHPAGEGAAAVATQVTAWLDGGADVGDVAVLARVRSCLLAPLVALLAAGVPVQSDLGPEVLERTGLRAALAYLRIATAADGAIAASDVTEILRRPSRGLPPWFADRLRRRSAWSVRQLAGLSVGVDDKVGGKVQRLVADLETLRGAARRGTASDVLAVVRGEIGLGTAMGLLDSSGREGSSHLDDLEALGELALLHPDAASLEPWVREHLAGRRAAGGEGVVLSTVHRVKGLEWDRVVVAGVSAGLLPHRLAEEDGDGEEEERRILHVAITRGRHEVVVVGDAARPSPFLAELDGSAPHVAPAERRPVRSATGATGGGRPGGGAGATRRARAGTAGGPRHLEARLGLAVTLPGGFEGTVTATDAEGATVGLASGAALRSRWGEAVSVHGRDVILVAPADLSPEVAATEAALRSWRTGRARRDHVAPFIVLSDRVLRAVATARPATLPALRSIDGIGPTKLEQYGEEVLEVVAGAVAGDVATVGDGAAGAAAVGAGDR